MIILIVKRVFVLFCRQAWMIGMAGTGNLPIGCPYFFTVFLSKNSP